MNGIRMMPYTPTTPLACREKLWRPESTNHMAERTLDLQYCFFIVDERPLCLWDENIHRRNEIFLDSIDSSYFEYLCRVHSQLIDDQEETTNSDEQHAALALRTAYSQALETLFALIFASIQAPWCVPAWINAYKNHELRSLIKKVQEEKEVISSLDTEKPSWSDIYDSLFTPFDTENREYNSSVRNGFIKTWQCFACDFLSNSFSREYNSIKHGLRVRSGGFKMRIGVPERPGSIPAPEKMFEVTNSKFGSSYLTSEKLGEQARHIRLRGENRNWDIESLHWGVQILAMSIENVRTVLKGRMQEGETQSVLKIPGDLADFEKWKGFVNLTDPEVTILPDFIHPFTKDEIIENYKAKKYGDTRRIVFEV